MTYFHDLRNLRAGLKIGPYMLVESLGRGAFAEVWVAERKTPIATSRIAVKIPLPGQTHLLEDLKTEAALWVKASGHPNVVPFIEADIYDGYVILASELMGEGSLAARLEGWRGQVSDVQTAATLIGGIGSGLAHIHGRGIIHRDLKPSNILFQAGVPRIADFGLARVLQTVSSSHSIAGTPAYMAPEAYLGVRDHRTDIWSLGVLFYQILAGRLPFSGNTYDELRGHIQGDSFEPLPRTVPDSIARLVARCLVKDPAQRLPDVNSLLAQLPTDSLPLRLNVESMPARMIAYQETGDGARVHYDFELLGNEILVGHADRFQKVVGSVAFLIVGPGRFEVSIESGIWYRWVNASAELNEALLQEQIEVLLNKYGRSVEQVKSVRLP